MTNIRKKLPFLMAATALGLSLAAYSAEAASPNIITSPRTVVKGDVTFNSPNANRLNATQNSNVAIVDHSGTSLNKGQRFNITQPSTSALYVARDTSGQQTVFAGRLNANGRVVILNRNGTLFTKDARINTAGLIVSSGQINDDAVFNNPDKIEFFNFGNGNIHNEGKITIKGGGLAALVGPNVRNSGEIKASLGRIELAGVGTRATVDLGGNDLIEFAVGEQSTRALNVRNTKKLEGATIALRTQDAVDVVNNVINTTGVITAKSASKKDGKIILGGGANSFANAKATMTSDGTVEITADTLRIQKNNKVNAKNGVTYTSDKARINNGNGSGKLKDGDRSHISAQALEFTLKKNRDVKVVTREGNLTISSKVDWNKKSTLTIDSAGDLNFNPTKNDQAAFLGTKGGVDIKAAGSVNFNSTKSKWTRINAKTVDIEAGDNLKLDGGKSAASIIASGNINIAAKKGDVNLLDNAQITSSGRNAKVTVTYGGAFSQTNAGSVSATGRNGVVDIRRVLPPVVVPPVARPPVFNNPVPVQPVVRLNNNPPNADQIEVEDIFNPQNLINFETFDSKGSLTILGNQDPRGGGQQGQQQGGLNLNIDNLANLEPASGPGAQNGNSNSSAGNSSCTSDISGSGSNVSLSFNADVGSRLNNKVDCN